LIVNIKYKDVEDQRKFNTIKPSTREDLTAVMLATKDQLSQELTITSVFIVIWP